MNDVLDFSKIESGELDLDEESFPLDILFAEVISMMAVRANEKGVNFVCDDTKIKDIKFYGDSGRLRQILVNLTGNAIKFTKSSGSVKVQSKLEDRDDEQYLRIDVSDTGIGINPDDFDAIFERFKQADSSVSRKYGGTGLGLPICQKIIVQRSLFYVIYLFICLVQNYKMSEINRYSSVESFSGPAPQFRNHSTGGKLPKVIEFYYVL